MAQSDVPDQVYHPNALSEGMAGLSCFIDQHRVCGADCMSYLPQAPAGDQYKGEQWAHCHLLVNLHRLGSHAVILVSQLSAKARQQQGEQIRAQSAPTVK